MPTATPSRRFIIVDDSTVREARDRQEEKRPKKRARRDDSDDEGAIKDAYLFSSPDSHPKGPYERDPIYYKEDDTANCVVRVRGHIFKVRRILRPFGFSDTHISTVDTIGDVVVLPRDERFSPDAR